VSVEAFVKQIPAKAFKPVVVNAQSYWTFTCTVRIPTLGKARLVISYQNAELTGTYVVLVTNCLDWEAKRIKSIGEACRQQARALIEMLITEAHQMLQNGKDVQTVFDFLFSKQLSGTSPGLAL